MDLVSLVSSSDQRLDQNVLRNQLSRSETMVCGIPKCTQTRSKKSLASGLCCDALLAGNQNHHLRKAINNHKNTVISPLGGWEAQHVVH
jgi:hypothetical protein